MSKTESPLAAREFAALMARFGPFEPSPHLAIGVSGGRDSMALALLADDWARACGGMVTALIVDHGLRTESAEEAAQVAAMLRARELAAEALRWAGAKPRTAIQATARDARRELLCEWCRRNGVLHLLLAHQADDQAETIAMRAERGSGQDGLAGMSAIVEMPDLRILRPLLCVPRARLTATLAARGQRWIDDPSNQNPAFRRSVLRAADLREPDDAAGSARIARERRLHKELARYVAIFPEGWARADMRLFAGDRQTAEAALTRLVMTIGGRAYPPRRERLVPLAARLHQGRLARGATLGGCLIVPGPGNVSIIREPEAIVSDPAPCTADRLFWDGRFVIRGVAKMRIAALGRRGWAEILAQAPHLRGFRQPYKVKIGLPSVHDLDGVREVYHLRYRRRDVNQSAPNLVNVTFRPSHPLASAGFVLS